MKNTKQSQFKNTQELKTAQPVATPEEGQNQQQKNNKKKHYKKFNHNQPKPIVEPKKKNFLTKLIDFFRGLFKK
jgi:hypothetical protein